MLYACDYDWWQHNRGRTDFRGLRLGADVRNNKWGVLPVKVDMRRHDIAVHKFGTVGSGGNSGFQALNLAVQFGCRNIILVGYDMHDQNGIHWHGKHDNGLRNPTRQSLGKWRVAIDRQAALLEQIGARVLNASLDSALTAYPKMTFDAALAACTED